MAAVREELDGRDGIQVRLFMRRSSDNDRRVGQRAGSGACAREGDRRMPDGVTEITVVSCQGAEE